MSLVKRKDHFISESKPTNSNLSSKVLKINRRAIKILSGLLTQSHMSQRMIETELGYAKGYFSQVLTGKIELKLDHITTVCELLEFPVTLFFQLVCESESLPEEIERYDNSLVKRMVNLLVVIYSEEPERMIKVLGSEK